MPSCGHRMIGGRKSRAWSKQLWPWLGAVLSQAPDSLQNTPPDRCSGKNDGEDDEEEEIMSPLKADGQMAGKEKEQMASHANRQLFQ